MISSLNIGKINTLREKLNQFLNYAIIIYAFVIPFQYYITKQLVEILLVLWILSVDYKSIINELKTNRVFQLVMALSSLILLSYLWSDYYPNTVYGDFKVFYKSFGYFFIFPIIIIITSLKSKYIPYIINSFLLSMFFNTIVSYGIFFEFWNTPIPLSSPANPIPFQVSHITYSVFVAFTILISLNRINQITNKYVKSLYVVFVVILFINLFLTQGRTGQFSLLLTLFIIIIIYNRRKIKRLLLFIISVCIMFVLAYLSINTFNARINIAVDEINMLLSSKKMKPSSLGDRALSFHASSYILEPKYLILGVGIGEREEYVKKRLKEENYPHKLPNFLDYGRLHNMYIETLISNGIVGLSLLILLLYSIFRSKVMNPDIKYIGYITGLMFTFVAITADIFFFYEMMLIFGLFLSIVSVQYSFEQKKLNY